MHAHKINDSIKKVSIDISRILLPSNLLPQRECGRVKVFKITKMNPEIYPRKLRDDEKKFKSPGSTSNQSPAYTLNSLHLQNPYRTLQKFESFNSSKNHTLKFRSSFLQKSHDVVSENNYSNRRQKNPFQNYEENKNKYNTKIHKIQMFLKKFKFFSLIEQYCANSTLHGLRYVGDTHVSIIEKLFWIFSFICAFLSASYFIWHLYNKWQASPIIISMSPEPVSFEEFPFPSVTICNMNNARKSEADRINDSDDNLEKLLLEDICDFRNSTDEVDEVFGSANWSNVFRFMINVSQPCTEMLYHCQWHGNTTDCDKLFNPTMTDEGMCCNFNSVHRKYMFYNPQEWEDLNITFPFNNMDWKPETGYKAAIHPDTQPWRPFGAGEYYGLTLVLDTAVDDYYCSSTASVGFKLLLHSPVETPKMADFGFAISPGEETRIIISPRILTASLSILEIPRKKRKCFFNSERKLKYYRTYTQRNCLLECEANFTQKICQCVQYYMPKSANTPICGKKDDPCATRARRLMETKLYDDEADKLNVTEIPSCNCWPGCFEINYEFTISHSSLTPKFYIDDAYVKQSKKYFKENMAIVHLFFIDSQFPKYVKSELFGFIEFLSSVGGLLGLFMGFSFLSVVEVVYFMTLRIWCRISWNERPQNTSNSLIHVQPCSNPNSNTIFPFSQ
ncbi:pickpocket protein 28-like [Chelonus insularis]|uniref:pickpocket protein 28-like n=1 Tax=Chelonus insularis TaxID=460826 RepID=UPI00158B9E57|nr:pickpocket protein 28-like [Chelonus insularis]